MSSSQELYTRLINTRRPVVSVAHIAHLTNWAWIVVEILQANSIALSRIAGDDHSARVAKLPRGGLGVLSPGVGTGVAGLADSDGDCDLGWREGVWRSLASVSVVAGAWGPGDSLLASPDISHRESIWEWVIGIEDVVGEAGDPRLAAEGGDDGRVGADSGFADEPPGEQGP